MLKFLRRYQKWMLVVFCAGLMVAFLIPQAAEQFAPQPNKKTMATTYDGQKITREMLVETSRDLQTIRRLRLDPIGLPGFSLVPLDDNLDAAMQWTLIQRAAEHNGLGASEQEAFTLLASVLDIQDQDTLEAEAAEMGANGAYLLKVAKQYLKAEQYRQLVGGIEYAKPDALTTQIGSPGVKRLNASAEALRAIRQSAQELRSFGYPEQQASMLAYQTVLFGEQAYFNKIAGHERVSTNQVRNWLQEQFTEVDLSVVLLDAEDRLATVSVNDDDIQSLFERYADDAPGTGEPYRLGYRVPNRVKLEAMRIPFEAVRASVAKQINPDDVRAYYDENRSSFIDFDGDFVDGQFPIRPLNAVLRSEIRKTLTQVRTAEKVGQIAQAARLRLNEDARGLEDDGSFKKLPKDFKPTPMSEIAAEIEQEHGISPEQFQIDDWVSAQASLDSAIFTESWLSEMPQSQIMLPGSGAMIERPIDETHLSGRAGLYASSVPGMSITMGQQRQQLIFPLYIEQAKPFIDPDSPTADLGLQVGLPARVTQDMTRSAYIFRLTDADPAHPATDMAPYADQLRADAQKVKAYEQLIDEKDQLLETATTRSIEVLLTRLDDKTTLPAVTRASLQSAPPTVTGLSSTGTLMEEAFSRAEQILKDGTLAEAEPADRVFIVDMPGDYKLAVVRIDAIRPLTRTDFAMRAAEPTTIALASIIDRAPDTPEALTLDSLMAATNFKWADDYGPETLSGEDEEEDNE